MNLHKFVKISVIFFIIFAWIFSSLPLRAVDGSGTNIVDPTTANSDETDTTFDFTFTAAETMDSGEISITVPSGWSTPQGISTTPGYTTAISTGMTADVLNALDTHTGWSVGSNITISADGADYQEGSYSISASITAAAQAGEKWYFNESGAKDFGSATKMIFWIKSSVSTTAGQLQFEVDDSADLASPLDTVNIPALTADTWTEVTISLGGTRSSVLSYGIKYTTDIGAATVKIDDIRAMFDDADSTTSWASDGRDMVISSEGTIKKQGTNSILCAFGSSNKFGKYYWTSATPRSFGSYTKVSFWIYTDDYSVTNGDLKWEVDDTQALASPLDSIDIPMLTRLVWNYVQVDLGATRTSVASYGINQSVDLGSHNEYIDAMALQVNTAESTTNWAKTSSMVLSTDTSVYHENAASLKNTVAVLAGAGDKWWYNLGAADDWSGYTNIGFWIRSTVSTNAGDLQFEYDDNTDLASPIASLDIGALTANTWSYQNLTLAGTRTTINSYGFKYTTDIGAATINADDILLGPGIPIFSGSGPWDINIRILNLANTETITLTYGDNAVGGGGVTVTSSTGGATVTTQSRISDSGTLTNIASSPVITVSAALVVDNVQLNGQVAIDLIENTTKSVSATADISHPTACNLITNVLAKIYRSGVSNDKDCTPDNNNCYSVASCSETSCVGTDAVYTCTIDMQFHTDSTDESAEYWRAWIEATDSVLTDSDYSPVDTPDVNTLRALNITGATTINYGALNPGQNSTSTNQQIMVTVTGNDAIDTRLYGIDMTWGGNIIDTANQEYSLSSFTYGDGNDLKESPSYDDVDADLPKPTESPSNSSDIFYWGLGVPSPMPSGGPYQGKNTFEAINDQGVLGWYNPSWGYRVKVTVLASEVDADLIDYPIYVDLSDLPAGFHTNVNQTDGRDIRVTKYNGTLEVPREVVFYDAATDTGELHFKGNVDDGTNTDFYIYYGNGGASDYARDAEFGLENVWKTAYKAVYHLHEAVNTDVGGYKDSTSNSIDLQGVSMALTEQDGQLAGKSQDFDGGADYINGGDVLDLGTNDMTISAWIYCDTKTASQYIISKAKAAAQSFRFGARTAITTGAIGSFFQGDGGADVIIDGTIDVSGGWHLGHFVFDRSGNVTVYTDSGDPQTGAISQWDGKDFQSDNPFRIGAYTASDNTSIYAPFDGRIDEVRIVWEALISTWISTEFNNQSSPSSFYTVGDQEESY